MALFDRKAERDEDLVSGTDAASRALSVAAVENDFVEGVYDKLAKVYDLTFGPSLHPGRLQAIQRMGITGQDRVLEVGVRDRLQQHLEIERQRHQTSGERLQKPALEILVHDF